jgi:uncharacterized damage-inducible protein DinB
MESLLNELRQEAETTGRLLERVPEDRLGWKPHPKSMTLGQLALHVATIPGDLCRLAQLEEFDAANADFEPPIPESKIAIEAAMKRSLNYAMEYLGALDAHQADSTWRLTLRGNEVFAIPRAALLRSLMLNHWYHHRGQLTVYLRTWSACGQHGRGRKKSEPDQKKYNHQYRLITDLVVRAAELFPVNKTPQRGDYDGTLGERQ